MIPPGHIHVANLQPAVQASRALGVTAEELAALGMTAEVLADPDGVVPADVTYRHFDWMSLRDDYPRFVVDAVQRHGLASLGIVGMAAKTLATVGEAVGCHQRFQHLTNRTATYVLEERDDHLVLWEDRPGGHPGRELVSVYGMLVAVRLLSLLASDPVKALSWGTRRVSIPPEERAALEGVMEVPLRAAVERSFVSLPRSILGGRVRTADPEFANYFTALLERVNDVDAGESSLLRQVREAVARELATGTPSGTAVARHLGMSQRTLQRRLRLEGLTFADVLASTRRGLAEKYLQDPALSMTEVAWLLGYREETSFYRSFRRWTGTTPASYRASSPRGQGLLG
ncbi:MAG: helix-turn-helix domain-containing protein [Deltaproteobacteria bacterium]|nr:helix-turn-helix domain-containing protein [Deltaproteobacteria bacterium]